MTKVVYPGSFDPFTKGHLDIVRQAAKLFDEVVVVVAKNSAKTCFLDAEERAAAIAKDVRFSNNVTVEVLEGGLLLTDLLKEKGISTVVRGIRSGAELDAESAYVKNLDALYGPEDDNVSPVFLQSHVNYSHISSSAVKSVQGNKGWVSLMSKYLPHNTAKLLFKMKRGDFLRDLWTGACEALAANWTEAKPICSTGFSKLVAVYNRVGYHTKSHIFDCLLKYYYASIKDGFTDWDEVMAFFWHDYIYVPGAADNERKSADACSEFLRLIGAREDKITSIDKHIMTTKEGTEPDPYSYVRDIDLSILGAEPEKYDEYKKLIKLEFSTFDTTTFNEGRVAWIKKTLGKAYIFNTFLYGKLYEKQARINLEGELKELTS